MASSDINTLVLTANLTSDPVLRSTSSGTSVCNLRVASTTLRKKDDAFEERSNYFDVIVWGRSGEACAEYLRKGSQVCIHGRLEWREWEDKETGAKRSAVEIIATDVKFMSRPRDSEPDLQPVPVGVAAGHVDDKDIPF